MIYSLSMVITSLRRKAKNGNVTGKSVPRHSLRYVCAINTLGESLTLQQPNNRMVRDETCRIMQDLFDNVWGAKQEIVVDHAVDITLPVGRCSFIA